MYILKLMFFRVHQIKHNLVRCQWFDVTFLCHVHVYDTSLHPKLKLLMKNIENLKRMILVYAVFLHSIMMLNAIFHFLTFQRTVWSHQVIVLMSEWHKQAPGKFLVVNHLKINPADRLPTTVSLKFRLALIFMN